MNNTKMNKARHLQKVIELVADKMGYEDKKEFAVKYGLLIKYVIEIEKKIKKHPHMFDKN